MTPEDTLDVGAVTPCPSLLTDNKTSTLQGHALAFDGPLWCNTRNFR
jgi:hypothetical protein